MGANLCVFNIRKAVLHPSQSSDCCDKFLCVAERDGAGKKMNVTARHIDAAGNTTEMESRKQSDESLLHVPQLALYADGDLP